MFNTYYFQESCYLTNHVEFILTKNFSLISTRGSEKYFSRKIWSKSYCDDKSWCWSFFESRHIQESPETGTDTAGQNIKER